MKKEITAEEKMEQETAASEETEQVEETKKKVPTWLKAAGIFAAGTITGIIVDKIFGCEAEEDDEVINLSEEDYRICESSDADSNE